MVHAVAEHVADRQEMRLAVAYHATVGRNAHLAVGEGIKCVNRLVARSAWHQMHHNHSRRRSVVVHLANLYLPLLLCRYYGRD